MPVSAQEHRVRTGLYSSCKGVWLRPQILEHPYSSRCMKGFDEDGLLVGDLATEMVMYIVFGLLPWGCQDLVTRIRSMSFISACHSTRRYMKGLIRERFKVGSFIVAKIFLCVTFILFLSDYTSPSWFNSNFCHLVRRSFSRLTQRSDIFLPYLSLVFVGFIVVAADILMRHRSRRQLTCEVVTISDGSETIVLQSEVQRVSAGRVCLTAVSVSLVLTAGIAVFILLMLSGDVETNPGPVTAPPLTVDNILLVLKGVEDKWDYLGLWLHVPGLVRERIEEQYSTSTEKLTATLKYFLQTDPYASWKSIVVALVWVNGVETAMRIKWIEPVSEASLNVHFVATIVSRMTEKHGTNLSDLVNFLTVPTELVIRFTYSTRHAQIIPIIRYWIDLVPDASWSTLAGALYQISGERETVLAACKEYLHPKDVTLTPDRVYSAVKDVEDWDALGVALNVPRRIRDEIILTHQSDPQRLYSLVEHYVNHHPAPSWRGVARALYTMNLGREENHQLLRMMFKDKNVPVSSRDPTRTLEVKPGDRVELSCSVSYSNPKYQWYCGDHPLAANDAEFEGTLSSVVVIKECLSKHVGYYKCAVNDAVGTTLMWSVETNLCLRALRPVKPEEAQLLGRMLRGVDPSKLTESGLNLEHLLRGHSDVHFEELQSSLSKIPEFSQFAENLDENLELRMTEELMYQKAMKDDTKVSLVYLKMLALGPGQVGKSTFLRRLMGLMKWDIDTAEEESQPSCSTGQAEMRRVHIERKTVTVSSTKTWHTFEDDHELEQQFSAITNLLNDQADLVTEAVPGIDSDIDSPIDNPDIEALTTELQSGLSDEDLPCPIAESPPEQMDRVPHEASDPQQQSRPTEKLPRDHKLLVPLTRPKEMEIEKLFTKFELLRMTQKQNDKDHLHIIINIADVGGQPAFLEMLPSLTIGPAMYLIFLKLLGDLKTPFPMMFRREGDQEAKSCKDYTYTSEEVIFTALSSIACFGLPDEEIENYVGKASNSEHKDSLALLLGTFADQMKDECSKKKIERIEEQLKEQLEETDFYDRGLVEYADSSQPQVLFTVDNKNGGQAEVEYYRNELEKLIENKFRKYEIPTRWFMLSVFLKMLARNEGKSTVSVLDCVEFGKKFNMEESMVKRALRFLHKYIGIVMYFPENEHLRDLVICNPQVVFTSITELIFNIYDPRKRQLSNAECDRFVQTGRFSPTDITVEERPDLLPINSLVNLLVHLNIAAPIPSSPDDYFLPAVLRSAEDKDLALPEQAWDNDEELPEPLCIRFRTGFLPLGFFCALVSNLVAAENFDLLDSKQKQVVRKNKITFRFRGRYDITLIAWPKYCEVRVSRSPEAPNDEEFSDSKSCPEIRQTLVEMINKVVEKMRQSSIFKTSQGYDLGFKCRKHPKADLGHEPIIVVDDPKYNQSVPKEILCIKCKITPMCLAGIRVWYGESVKINRQPEKEVHTRVNEDVTLSISASGTKPLTYQWMKDGTKLEEKDCYQGCSMSILSIKQVDCGLCGKYSCEVRDRFGEHIVSQESELTIVKTFSSDMTCEELCAWLKQNKIPDMDVENFRVQMIDGDAFSLLPCDESKVNTSLKCTLTFGGWSRLNGLIASVSDNTTAEPEAECSLAYNTMVKCTVQLTEAMSREPQALAGALHASGLISLTTLDETNQLNEIKRAKGRRLYGAVLSKIKVDASHYATFICILREDMVLYRDILEELEKHCPVPLQCSPGTYGHSSDVALSMTAPSYCDLEKYTGSLQQN